MSDGSTPTSQADTDSTATPSSSSQQQMPEDWRSISDPGQRRKIQNRIAQRAFRQRKRIEKDAKAQREHFERTTSAAYVPPELDEIDDEQEEGLPWGGPSVSYMIAPGQIRPTSIGESSSYPTVPRGSSTLRYGTADAPDRQYRRPLTAPADIRAGSVDAQSYGAHLPNQPNGPPWQMHLSTKPSNPNIAQSRQTTPDGNTIAQYHTGSQHKKSGS